MTRCFILGLIAATLSPAMPLLLLAQNQTRPRRPSEPQSSNVQTQQRSAKVDKQSTQPQKPTWQIVKEGGIRQGISREFNQILKEQGVEVDTRELEVELIQKEGGQTTYHIRMKNRPRATSPSSSGLPPIQNRLDVHRDYQVERIGLADQGSQREVEAHNQLQEAGDVDSIQQQLHRLERRMLELDRKLQRILQRLEKR